MFRVLYPTLGPLKAKLQFHAREKYNRLVDFGMSNSQESILVVKPLLNQLKYIKNWSIAKNFAFFPDLTS